MSPLPYLTDEWTGIGGRLKDQPEDFQVEEIPAYEPSGSGEHLYLWVEKRDLPHDRLLRVISKTLDIRTDDIGSAGMKDRRAVTRQYVSVPQRCGDKVSLLDSDELRVLRATQHTNKLRTGHLRGNRFVVVVRGTDPRSPDLVATVAEKLRQVGFPNYYGEQRFGIDGQTLQLGLDLLAGTKAPRDIPYAKRKFLLRLALSSVQSDLFNQALAQRLRDGLLQTVLPGDVMEVTESGGKFVVEDTAREQARLNDGQITVTGPMFGLKMLMPTTDAAEREALLLEKSRVKLDDFAKFSQLLAGARRSYLVHCNDLIVSPVADGIKFEFSLATGAYATMLLREFMKADEVPAETPLPNADDELPADDAGE